MKWNVLTSVLGTNSAASESDIALLQIMEDAIRAIFLTVNLLARLEVLHNTNKVSMLVGHVVVADNVFTDVRRLLKDASLVELSCQLLGKKIGDGHWLLLNSVLPRTLWVLAYPLFPIKASGAATAFLANNTFSAGSLEADCSHFLKRFLGQEGRSQWSRGCSNVRGTFSEESWVVRMRNHAAVFRPKVKIVSAIDIQAGPTSLVDHLAFHDACSTWVHWARSIRQGKIW